MKAYKQHIDNITETFDTILKGKRPTIIELPLDFPENEIKQLTSYFNKFITQFNDFSDFTFKISSGELNIEVPGGKTRIFQSIKSIHSDLCHLTWKTQKIAKGDYNQKVIFMGEFSDAFNKMTEQLSESKTFLEKKIEERTKELVCAKEKAEESDRLKSAFLANMSHEIRTPMNGILGFADLLKQANLTSKQKHTYIELIEKSGIRMLNIINNIVNISKIESGTVNVNHGELNINEQMEYAYSFFKPEVEAKGINFSYKNSLQSEELILKTDKDKFMSILTNLIKNAIKYTDKGSIEFGYHIKGQFLEFHIKDTGIGIDNKRQEAIFERFIQADIEDRMARQGAGLGLAISKAYVEMLDGNIWIESEKDKGSIFYFTIPYCTESNNSDKAVITNSHTEIENQPNRLKVLIVEDDETSGLLLEIMLKKINCEISHAKNGVEAIEFCKGNPEFDIVLMDIKMPVMDGYEATRQIRQFNKDIFIIAQTAHTLVGNVEKAMQAGCNKHLPKPIRKNELFSIIKKQFIK